MDLLPDLSAFHMLVCIISVSLFRYHLVLQETNEERRTVANNLCGVFSTATNHLSIVEASPLSSCTLR